MNIHVNTCVSKIICMPINVGVCPYAMYTICWTLHLMVYFNNSPVIQSSSQKYLFIHLDEELNFIHHIKGKISKANKSVGVIKKNECSTQKSSIDSISLLSDLIWIMGTSYMISQKIKAFVITLKLFNTMQHWLLLGQLWEHQK